MPPTMRTRSKDEIGRLGDEIYERDIRRQVEADHDGELLAIDVDSGNWAIGDELLDEVDRLRAQHPEAINVYRVRVGYRAVASLGGGAPPRSDRLVTRAISPLRPQSQESVTMPNAPTLSSEETARRGDEIYERDIRREVEADHHGEVVAIDVESGEWAIGENVIAATDRLWERHPAAIDIWSLRVGHRALHHFGGRPVRSAE